jgi:DNA-binding PadR family transcriptional regulator
MATFCHVLLGLLRDGVTRHGYELVKDYRARTGNRLSPGNAYRELARLARAGLVGVRDVAEGEDARRIPYRITDAGRQVFDRWLAAPQTLDDDLAAWLLFADRLPPAIRDHMLERRHEDADIHLRLLRRQREDRGLLTTTTGWDPLFVLLSQRMKRAAVELEILDDLRASLQALAAGRPPAGGRNGRGPRPATPGSRLRNAATRA